jgi:hypothetical protein
MNFVLKNIGRVFFYRQDTVTYICKGCYSSLRNWILEFLTGRPQVVRVGNNTSGPSGVC